MESEMIENPVVVRMIQAVYYQTLINKVKDDKDYLNECSIDDFIKISELIRDSEEPNFTVIRELVFNVIYREDLLPISDLVLCNIGYYLEKFSEFDYKYQDAIGNFLITQFKKEICIFNVYLLKYVLELIKKNVLKFKPESKSELLDVLL
jgi:hypothetical protein